MEYRLFENERDDGQMRWTVARVEVSGEVIAGQSWSRQGEHHDVVTGLHERTAMKVCGALNEAVYVEQKRALKRNILFLILFVALLNMGIMLAPPEYDLIVGGVALILGIIFLVKNAHPED